jgi:hypothetical protein
LSPDRYDFWTLDTCAPYLLEKAYSIMKVQNVSAMMATYLILYDTIRLDPNTPTENAEHI